MPPPFFCYRNVWIHGSTPSFVASARRLTEAVLWLERVPSDAELSLHFVRPAQMHALNYEHRGLDRPTDVLTFPGSGSGTPEAKWLNGVLFPVNDEEKRHRQGAGRAGDGCGADAIQERAALLDLGEIYFSVEFIWAQCMRRPGRNLPLMVYLEAALVHALLHALGHDHDTPQGWKRMSRREKFIAARLSTWRRRYPGDRMRLEDAELLRHLRIEK